jgi:hypothetical protein
LIGDLIGIAVMTPLILRLALFRRPLFNRISLRMLSELLLFVTLVIAVLWVIVAVAGPDGSRLFYLLFLPVVVAAVRYGLDGACIGLAITQLGLVGLLHRYGYDANAFTACHHKGAQKRQGVLAVARLQAEAEHAPMLLRGPGTRGK